ncbi:MAG: alpha/beta hydrolase [Paracoccaceae bacterium]
MTRFIILSLLVLVGCSDRTLAPIVARAALTGSIEKVFVATSRDVNPLGNFDGARRPDLSYLMLDVAVPPEHEAGKIRPPSKTPKLEREFSIAARKDYGANKDFTAELRRAIAQDSSGSREVTIYVHGYNNSFSDGAFRTAQLMYDFEIPGTAVHYSWPSAANPLGYTHDRDSVLFARDGLERLLRDVRAAGPSRIVLIGHSMGTLLIMEALRQIDIADPGWSQRAIGGVILISPDIDIDVFKTQAGRIAGLPEPFAIFVSQKDRALSLSARLNGSSARLGRISDPAELAELPVTLVDVSEFANTPAAHFTLGTSPALITLLSDAEALQKAFSRDRAGSAGLLPGTLLTVQNATQLILSPALLLTNEAQCANNGIQRRGRC